MSGKGKKRPPNGGSREGKVASGAADSHKIPNAAPGSIGREDVPADRSFKPRDWFFAAALVVAVFLVYQPAWQGGLIWDDDRSRNESRTAFLARTLPHLVRPWGHAAILSLDTQRFLDRAQALGRRHARLPPGEPPAARHGGPDGGCVSAAGSTRRLPGGGDLRPPSSSCRIGGLDHGVEKHPFGCLLPGGRQPPTSTSTRRERSSWYVDERSRLVFPRPG